MEDLQGKYILCENENVFFTSDADTEEFHCMFLKSKS